jgi:hypothetical protein
MMLSIIHVHSGIAALAFLQGTQLSPSVVTAKAAIRGHFKTGHRDWPET